MTLNFFKKKILPRKFIFFNETFNSLLISKIYVNLITYTLALLMIMIFPAKETELFFYIMAVGSIFGGLSTLGGTYYNLLSLQPKNSSYIITLIFLIISLQILFFLNLFKINSGNEISRLLGIHGENIIIISLFFSVTIISHCTLLISSNIKLCGKYTIAAFIERLPLISCFTIHILFLEILFTVLCIILVSTFFCFFTIYYIIKNNSLDRKFANSTPKIIKSIYYYELTMVNIPLIGALYFFEAETGIWFRMLSLFFALFETFTQSRLLRSRQENIGIYQVTSFKSATILLTTNIIYIFLLTNFFVDQYFNIFIGIIVSFIVVSKLYSLITNYKINERYNNHYDLLVCIISFIVLFLYMHNNEMLIFNYIICIILIRFNPAYILLNSK